MGCSDGAQKKHQWKKVMEQSQMKKVKRKKSKVKMSKEKSQTIADVLLHLS